MNITFIILGKIENAIQKFYVCLRFKTVFMSRKYFNIINTTFLLFIIFVIIWFVYFSRFSILYYQEQTQLFRFDKLYFYSYINQPGGLIEYIGSFFTQFYYYPVIGSMIIGVVIASVFMLFYSICKSNGCIERAFCIPFISAIILFMYFLNAAFYLSYSLGLVLFLVVFRQYVKLQQHIRLPVGIVLFTVLYLIAGGNAFLFSAMMIIFECFENKYRFKYWYMLVLVVWSVLLPYLALKLLYVITIHEAYYASTPFISLSSTMPKTEWLSIPILYLFWRLIAVKVNLLAIKSYKLVILNSSLIILMFAYGSYSTYNRRLEMFQHIAYEVQHEDWENVSVLSKQFPDPNPFVCYFNNIALAESGQMPYRMFQYSQIGVAGLFIDSQLNYSSLWWLGEIYYRMGIIPIAERYAFSAIVGGNTKEPDTQTLRRMLITNIARRDSATAVKYIGYFEHSLAYRKLAQQQHENLSFAMADTSFNIPNTPAPSCYNDFFHSKQNPDYALLMLLQSNPTHRLTFEYLMAYYMLQKDIERTKWCFDNFFWNLGYPDIPTHYEEALILYQNVVQAGNDYPISHVTIERFNRYMQAAQGSQRNFEYFQKQFGNTYWYYVHFVESSTNQQQDEQKIY